MKSAIVKHSVVIAGHKTSISLEDGFWECLRRIANERRQTLSALVGSIDDDRQRGTLSSAIRLFVLGCFYRDQPEPNGGTRLAA
jgi:predicted DNA-binding ribbon-helix-helix protein